MAREATGAVPAGAAPELGRAAPRLADGPQRSVLAGVRRRVASVRPGAWLLALTVGSVIDLVILARDRPGPWILPDELVYSELARSVADSGRLLLRDAEGPQFSSLYSVLIAPAYALTSGLVAGYAAAKAVSAMLFSLTAVPAYLLARRLLSPGWSVVAAALAVAVPSAAYAGVLMTENAFYPLFVTFALALVAALQRPSFGRQLLVLALAALAFLARAQGVVLFPAIVTAIVLVAALDARAPDAPRRTVARTLGRFWPTWLAFATGGALLLVVQTLRGQRLVDVLGPYSAAVHAYSPVETARWFVYHVAGLDLYLGVLPFAAFLVVAAAVLGGGASREARVLVAVTVAVTAWLIGLAAATAAELPEGHTALPPRLHERYVFYVAPLFVTLALWWVKGGMPRPRRAAWPAAVVAALLPAVIPFGELAHVASEAPALVLWTEIATPQLWVVALGAAAAAVFLALPRRFGFAIPLLLAANFLFFRSLADGNGDTLSRWVLGMSISVERDWIDAAVGRDARVAALWVGTPSVASDHVGRGSARLFRRHRRIWLNEFFNESVGPVYYLRSPMLAPLPSEQVTRGRDGTLLDSRGRPVRTEYVLAESATRVAGRAIARDPGTSMVLYRVAGPVRLASARRGNR